MTIYGLKSAEVEQRRRQGLDNKEIEPPTKTVGQIFKSNILTYFNAIFAVLAIGIITTGSWQNLTFLGVVISNTVIGIVQELKSKRTLDKMALLTEQKCSVVRDGAEQKIGVHDTVRDDIVLFSAGSQIFADALVVDGECVANEALITGEADEIRKKPGDALISGSFVMSGKCAARLTDVGENSFAAKLTIEAKKSKNRGKSEMMNSLSRLIKVISFILIPLGVALFISEFFILDKPYGESVIATVGALIGMVPEGLYLLTSLALVASVIRLTKKRTLVHELGCIETLARVDTLCVDKTGTITENKMTVEDVVPLTHELGEAQIARIMADYVFAQQADNATMIALKKYFTGKAIRTAVDALPFSSSNKYGAVVFDGGEAFLLGAPDVILGDRYDAVAPTVDKFSEKGCRVLLLAAFVGDPTVTPLSGKTTPIALILLANKIRDEAPETFRYFAENDVTVKVISGDNAMAVSEVARRAGIEGAEFYVDARELDTDEKIAAAANEYNVFGRVTPEQKRKLIRSMRKAGHTVAMTGDGVNDVLALKEADCSVAMASGSEIASQASHIVLLDSDFSAMPSVVAEGRRVINNIERSASLYLWKNIFSLVLAVVTLIFSLHYPLEPTQLSLISALTIGIPSFVLALEPNTNLVRGHFMKNVLYRAIPAGVTATFMVIGVMLFDVAFGLSETRAAQISTVCAMIVGIVGLLMLYATSLPLNRIRLALCAGMTVALVFGAILFSWWFKLVALDFQNGLVLAVFAIMSIPTFIGMQMLTKHMGDWLSTLRRKFKAAKDA